jgi:hypothetical protein
MHPHILFNRAVLRLGVHGYMWAILLIREIFSCAQSQAEIEHGQFLKRLVQFSSGY